MLYEDVSYKVEYDHRNAKYLALIHVYIHKSFAQ